MNYKKHAVLLGVLASILICVFAYYFWNYMADTKNTNYPVVLAITMTVILLIAVIPLAIGRDVAHKFYLSNTEINAKDYINVKNMLEKHPKLFKYINNNDCISLSEYNNLIEEHNFLNHKKKEKKLNDELKKAKEYLKQNAT